MLFNSIDYLLLLTALVPVYWFSSNQSVRLYALFFGSAAFYISWSFPFYLMLLGILFVYYFALNSHFFRSTKTLFVFLVFLLLALLAYFKYSEFIVVNIPWLFRDFLDIKEGSAGYSIILPLGISFYIFQLIAYVVDVYTRKCEPEKNVIKLFVFITFFPQLIAGPICRSYHLLPQLSDARKFSPEQLTNGLFMILCGFLLKTGLADGLAPYVDTIFSNPAKYSGFDNISAVAGFGIQIFCDFWGYSLMALGSAKLFGIHLPHNFNLPYISLSISEFWRRWHMTLSLWLRDYLYIPLGGNRGGTHFKTPRNLLITMVLGGLWHGANWTFIVWGAIHGFALVINKYYNVFSFGYLFNYLVRIKLISWLVTMAVVLFSWIFFRAENMSLAIDQLGIIFNPSEIWFDSRIDINFWELIILFIPLHLLIHTLTYDYSIYKLSLVRLTAGFTIICVLSLIYYTEGSDFIYFQF